MPRPTRAQGRPGTRVIPVGFEESHAAVVRKAATARCKVWSQTAGTPQINDDLTYDPTTEPAPVYDDACRIQALDNKDIVVALGEEVQARSAYLFVLDRSADDIHRGDQVVVTECTDPTLMVEGHVLTVARVTRGSLRWERDVYCIDPLERSAS